MSRRLARTSSATGRSGRGPCRGSGVGRTTSNARQPVRRDEQQPVVADAYRSRTLPRADERLSAARHGRASSAVEAGDDLGHVAKQRGVVEAGVEVGERQLLGDDGVGREQVAQRPPLVGGPQGGALDDP